MSVLADARRLTCIQAIALLCCCGVRALDGVRDGFRGVPSKYVSSSFILSFWNEFGVTVTESGPRRELFPAADISANDCSVRIFGKRAQSPFCSGER